ncbi:hypothetical protein BS50DRAFT_629507 [Corynespora cassiicola Philippines]|uniref:Uncharacterized protein n=1 Tax=Corynespora cassiicola Philippines TaxID=1448308 RepID=A0A2T2P820_CORCC|nr:hypothetical protein BS50DRAFT_629507 [Corynespora cassiicola Philippines]
MASSSEAGPLSLIDGHKQQYRNILQRLSDSLKSQEYKNFIDKNKDKNLEYTDLIVRTNKWWVCPLCRRAKTDQDGDRYLRSLGYEIIADSPDYLKFVYMGSDKNLFFQNPPHATRCLNQSSFLSIDQQCVFDRVEAAGRREVEETKVLEEIKEDSRFLFWCTECSVTEEHVKHNQERLDYIQSQTDTMNGYQKRPLPWYKNKMGFVRCVKYDGTPESLKCKTMYWGQGEREKGKACEGHYGRKKYTWALKFEDSEIATKGDYISWLDGQGNQPAQRTEVPSSTSESELSE